MSKPQIKTHIDYLNSHILLMQIFKGSSYTRCINFYKFKSQMIFFQIQDYKLILLNIYIIKKKLIHYPLQILIVGRRCWWKRRIFINVQCILADEHMKGVSSLHFQDRIGTSFESGVQKRFPALVIWKRSWTWVEGIRNWFLVAAVNLTGVAHRQSWSNCSMNINAWN